MSVLPVPGQWVRLPNAPQWGIGQVQSVAGTRVTVNFIHAGKRLVRTDRVALELTDPSKEQEDR